MTCPITITAQDIWSTKLAQ